MTRPDYLGRCDICGVPIDLEHSGDHLVVVTREDFGNPDVGVSPDEALDAVLDALSYSDRPEDTALARALREYDGYRVHGRCFDTTSLADVGVAHDG